MLHEYNRYDRKTSDLDIYCRLEGFNRDYLLSTIKPEKSAKKRRLWVAVFLAITDKLGQRKKTSHCEELGTPSQTLKANTIPLTRHSK